MPRRLKAWNKDQDGTGANHIWLNMYMISFFLIKMFLYFIEILLFLVIFAFILFAGQECVRLPNGIIVSRDSYFNFTKPYLGSGVVVKGPDGTIFSRGNDETFYFSETTAWWVDEHHSDNPYFGYEDDAHLPETGHEALAYRPDVGLVRAWKDRTLYEQLKREAGPLLEEGKKVRNTNVLGILTFLIDDPKYYSRDCHVPLFTFEESYP